jgi:hypothetical protein
MSAARYAELQCTSHFSFLRGARAWPAPERDPQGLAEDALQFGLGIDDILLALAAAQRVLAVTHFRKVTQPLLR